MQNLVIPSTYSRTPRAKYAYIDGYNQAAQGLDNMLAKYGRVSMTNKEAERKAYMAGYTAGTATH